MSWDKFDANRASNASPRSADKLAEAVKSAHGDSSVAEGGIRRGEGGVEHRAVESRPVVARRVTRPVKKSLAPSPMAESKAPTAAQRLVEARDTRAKAHYSDVAERATKASDEAKDAKGHAEAYRQHMHAANLAPTETLRQMHMKIAVSHDRANVHEKNVAQRAESLHEAQTRAGQAATPARKSTQVEKQARADKTRADYLESKAQTPPDQRAAEAARGRATRSADKLAAQATNKRTIEQEIEQVKKDHPNVGLLVHRSSTGHVVVSKIVVPKESRGKGEGGQIMKRLTDAADRNGDTMALTPSKDFGASSVARLTAFYKGHGFVPNKGKSKDYETRETMIRQPKKK